ncbi:MAG: DUF599 domain-containing protein [Burkholderiales bacterium]
MKLPFSLLDWMSLCWFFSIWVGYQYFADWRARNGHPSLMSVMGGFRREWWQQVIEREQRVVDVVILTNLSNAATFFASTTLLILGGLLALLGTSEKVIAVMAELPFSARSPDSIWEFKILLLIAIFVYAFFKFTWSLRQHNFSSVLVGAAPAHDTDPRRFADYTGRASRIASMAADSFNYGLRAYYFGLAALTWFLNSWVFMAATTWVLVILYWREFRSEALRTLERRVAARPPNMEPASAEHPERRPPVPGGSMPNSDRKSSKNSF